MPQGISKPNNQVLAAGSPLRVEMEIGANATAAKMLPGRQLSLMMRTKRSKRQVPKRPGTYSSWTCRLLSLRRPLTLLAIQLWLLLAIV